VTRADFPLDLTADQEVMRGPHAPSAECVRCRELFAGEPPMVAVDKEGHSLIDDVRHVFASVAHHLGYSSFRLQPGRVKIQRGRYQR